MKYLIRKELFKSLFLSLLMVGTIFSDAPTPAIDQTNVLDGELISSRTYGTPSIETEINFHGRVAIDGDIVFTADPNKVLRVSLGKSSVSTTYIEPLISTTAAPKTGNLIFDPQEGGVIYVDVYTDLYLTGSNVDDSKINIVSTPPEDLFNTELGVIFRGKGTTVFNIVNGKKVVATSLIEQNPTTLIQTSTPATLTDRKPMGTAMYIAMDQNLQEVVDKGFNKVVIQRKDFQLPNNHLDCEFQVGLNSKLTFISKNYTGLDDSSDPLHNNIPRNLDSTGLQSYAALAFDVSNAGKGKMIFNIEGPQIDQNTYTDGAFVLAGHYLQDSADNLTALPGNYLSSTDVRNYVNFSQAAGCKAYLRVIDNLNYFFDKNAANVDDSHYIDSLNPVGDSEVGLVDNAHSRRALHITCNNKSIAPLASNSYGDSGNYLQEIFDSGRGTSAIRPGFVLGLNGHIEVSHNTFLDYEAKNNNLNFEPLNIGLISLDGLLTSAGVVNPAEIFKQRNPSAMLVDGLGSVMILSQEKIKFLAHLREDIFRRAEITLYGNASINFRAPLLTTTVGLVTSPTRGTYDGFRVAANGETLNDGVFVLDLEGALTIRSLPDIATPFGASSVSGGYLNGLHFGSNYPSAGVLRFPTIWRSYDDREILDLSGLTASFITRPLSLDSSTLSPVQYARYDRPTVLLNNKLDFIGLNFHHDDISRYIKPNVNESPAIICGGELSSFLNRVFELPNPDLPQLRLYDSKIHCHESICVSGTRIVMRELPDILSISGFIEQNLSSIIMYNHGDMLDNNLKGFGRVFLLGSTLNKTANNTRYPFMESSYFNIFRGSGGDAITGAGPINLPVKLSLETKSELTVGASPSEKASQLFFLGNNSNVEIGWTSDVGLLRDSSDLAIFPWDHRPSSYVTNNSNKFNLRADQESPATLSFAGDFISLGGIGPNGEASPQIVNDYNLGRVIYLGHGSKIEITSDLTDPLNPRPYIGFSNAAISMQLWKQEQPALNTQIDLPYDQMILTQPIQAFNINMNTLTDATTNKYLPLSFLTRPSVPGSTDNKFGTTAYVAWNNIIKLPGLTGFRDLFNSRAFRSISRLTGPVNMPGQGLLSMSTGDYLDQLSVSGATLTDPFLLYMSGSLSGISQIREFVSVASPMPIPGEGSFAKIFMDQGARIGIGSRNTNIKSAGSWSVIGRNFVTLVPNGDCQVDLNSDITIGDAQPIIPTVNFGSQIINPLNPTLIIKPTHRITFYSHDQKEIRVPAGKELDLSAFGGATTDQTGTQQIAFGGKIRLIFEPGSTLRFPDLTGINVDKRPILYMNESSQIIFEGVQDMENKFIGDPANLTRWEKIRDSDRAKIRIVGTGDIWINKTSKMVINDGAIVGIEADATSPHTSVTVSLQREGSLEIGSQNILGGSLQIGNPKFLPNNTAYNVTDAEISFTLRLNSESCNAYFGRNSFFGCGVGVVDRFEERINSRWKLQQLKYVKNINIRNISGIISHNQIYDGTSKESSLWAIGPTMTGGNYKFEFGQNNGILQGGGNIVFVADSPTSTASDLVSVNILSRVVPLTGDAADTGKYSIINSAFLLQKLPFIDVAEAGTKTSFVDAGTSSPAANAAVFSEGGLNGGFGFSGSSRDAFKYLSFRDLISQPLSKFVTLGKSPLEKRIGYVFNNTITRSTNIALELGLRMVDLDLIKNGILEVATKNQDKSPDKFKLQG